jgi:hypothetical protein
MRFSILAAASAILCAGAPLCAEVVEQKEGHFVTKDEAIVEADLKQTWLALIQPSKWWSAAHTFTGDAANLQLTPQASGCFCEKVPEVDEPGRFTLEGSVEHMRVVNSMPETALRMIGALGPLQSEPVTGVLTISMSKVDEGTRIVWEYNVAGSMRYKTEDISKAVDGVMTLQLAGLAKLLGRVDTPAEEADGPSADGAEADTAGEPEAKPRETVDDAFSDLEGNG